MKKYSESELFSAIAVVALLLLTAFGNAYLMFVAGGIGLIVGLFLMKGKLGFGGWLAAIVGCATAILIALFILLR